MNTNYINYLIAKKSSKNTIDTYVKAVDGCLRWIGKEDSEIKTLDLINWMASISDMSSASIALKLSAVKSYFKFLKLMDVISINPAEGIEAPSIKNKEKHYMDADDIKAMLANCRSIRDTAIILTYATTGMRYAELSCITMNDWNEMLSNGMNYITITGKGDKQRNVYFNEQTMNAIKRYLKCRHVDSEWLFASNEGNQIARQNMSHMLKTTAKRAGIAFANDISNHQMRAAFCTIAADKGVNVGVIRDMMGHQSLTTTTKYLKTSARQKEMACDRMVF